MTNVKWIQKWVKSENDGNGDFGTIHLLMANGKIDVRFNMSLALRYSSSAEDLQSRENVVILSLQAFLLHLSRNRFTILRKHFRKLLLEENGNRTQRFTVIWMRKPSEESSLHVRISDEHLQFFGRKESFLARFILRVFVWAHSLKTLNVAWNC
jgi:hypothetical protein